MFENVTSTSLHLLNIRNNLAMAINEIRLYSYLGASGEKFSRKRENAQYDVNAAIVDKNDGTIVCRTFFDSC